ncbi:DUF2931 family protein [Luteimonas abyssi]|uniref:DUF2931 family protein n=1 Tax=Luteimonas abyssi TaxID=1247514 RepID=UPI000737CB45|nr:DUF2931 family protein [Luteimonas abyssi]
MKRLWLAVLLLVMLPGCVSGTSTAVRGLPYDAWALRFIAPNYMSAWIEAARVEDMDGRVFPRSGSGTAGISYSGSAAGWPATLGASPGRSIIGASLPARIHVRWQSLVEPQTYEATLEIPEEVRALMLTQAPSVRDPNRSSYRDRLVVGLAPGGAIKVWVSGTLGNPVEVMCAQASVVAGGPDGGRYGGRYVTLPERARPYVEAHPIPYGSWTCGAD